MPSYRCKPSCSAGRSISSTNTRKRNSRSWTGHGTHGASRWERYRFRCKTGLPVNASLDHGRNVMNAIKKVVVPAEILATVAAAEPVPAQADPIADFYRGKTLRVLIGYGPGGGYDIYGRLVAEFLGRHIPGNPTIVPINMPGGASLKAVEYLYQVAPKDGTHLGSVAQQLAMNAVVSDKNTFDLRLLRYIGRLTSNIDIAVAMPKTGITSFEDARKREIVI